MNDSISRESVLAMIGVMYERCDTYDITDYRDLMLECTKALPSVDKPNAVDLSSVYSTAYKSGYEKGKTNRSKGHYIKGENGEWYCSNCRRIDDKYSVARYCWYCGARMK